MKQHEADMRKEESWFLHEVRIIGANYVSLLSVRSSRDAFTLVEWNDTFLLKLFHSRLFIHSHSIAEDKL